jgi:hypothetical protein
MGTIALPANVRPVQKNMRFAIAGLSDDSALDVPGCHSAPAATLLTRIQTTNVHPKRGFMKGSTPPAPSVWDTAVLILARSTRSSTATVATSIPTVRITNCI